MALSAVSEYKELGPVWHFWANDILPIAQFRKIVTSFYRNYLLGHSNDLLRSKVRNRWLLY